MINKWTIMTTMTHVRLDWWRASAHPLLAVESYEFRTSKQTVGEALGRWWHSQWSFDNNRILPPFCVRVNSICRGIGCESSLVTKRPLVFSHCRMANSMTKTIHTEDPILFFDPVESAKNNVIYCNGREMWIYFIRSAKWNKQVLFDLTTTNDDGPI